MRRVTKVMTQDGKTHDTEKDAIRHAGAVYGRALTDLAHKAVRIDKYGPMCEWIEANLYAFIALHALKLDMEMIEDDDE
jgi:hypothetical protein